MPHRVFISYASQNSQFADQIYIHLKNSGVSCWMAPHDIPPAESWLKAIMQAIRTCDVVVLLLCSHANASKYVVTEVQQAFDHNKKIIAVRLEDLNLCDELKFLLSTIHWLEAHAISREAVLHRLKEAVKALTESVEPASNTPPPDDPLDSMPLNDLVKEGIDLVMTEIANLLEMDKPITPREINRVLDAAIYYGAPAYNRGSIIGCADIYLTTCKGLAKALGAGPIPSDVPWASPFNRFVSQMKAIQLDYPQIEKATANQLAWALRYRFDGFHAALGIQEIQDMMDQIEATDAPIERDVILLPVLVAVQHGNRAFAAKDLEGCAELHHYTATRLCLFLAKAAPKSTLGGDPHSTKLHQDDMETRKMSQSMLRSDPHLFMFHQDLQGILKKHPQVDPTVAQNLAWDLYSTFLQIVKAPPA